MKIAGFWRRLFALLIDCFVLFAIGLFLGMIFGKEFAALGDWGRAVGFIIATCYFGTLNSRFFHGQTLGKMFTGIRVVGVNRKLLSVPESFVRSSVLCFPYFLNGVQIRTEFGATWLTTVQSLICLGAGLSIVYLYVFNRRTRQSLHDFVVGSCVVSIYYQMEYKPIERVCRGHYAVVTALFVGAVASSIYVRYLSTTAPIADLLALQKLLEQEVDVQSVGVHLMTTIQFAGGAPRTQARLSIRANNPRSPAEEEAIINQLASLTLGAYPNAARLDTIDVSIAKGYDIGIASMWTRKRYIYSPQHWRERL